MSGYKFHEITTTKNYSNAPFNIKNCLTVYGDITKDNSPLFFTNKSDVNYILTSPESITNDLDMCFKLACYIYHNVRQKTSKQILFIFADDTIGEKLGEQFPEYFVIIKSYEMVEAWFPKSMFEIEDYFINYYLKIQEYLGQRFTIDVNTFTKDENILYRYLFFVSLNLEKYKCIESINFIMEQMAEKNYIKMNRTNIFIEFIITDEAIDTFQHSLVNPQTKTAFIAIKFDGNEERISHIRKAITDSHYEPIDMLDYQTNEWIMPEIFHQIDLATFVVVDLSLPCAGAYYEAGYAQAKGKEVIHLFDKREKEKNPLHFDVAQKSTIMYDDFNDLEIKLKLRIDATVH